MTSRLATPGCRLLALALAALPCAAQEEHNDWPFWVEQSDGGKDSWNSLGPLFFSAPLDEGGRVEGFRPFYLRWSGAGGDTTETTLLYPLVHRRDYGDTYEWSFFDLINHYGRRDGAPPTPRTEAQTLDVWPFYFSRRTGDPATSYRAVLPFGGSVQDRLGYTRLSWVLFPLYFRSERDGIATTSAPWPIVKRVTGAAHGFALWPLFGRVDGPGPLRSRYYLWPLIWDNEARPGLQAPEQAPPTHQVGFLPFYSAQHGLGVDEENYLWPFFGVTHDTVPKRYDETRYFWPFLVQGRGPDHWVDRWGPFYTHSIIDGVDKTWVLWPLWRQARWTDDGLDQTQRQLFFFFYWSLRQRSASRPSLPSAEKAHYWPLVSVWDNGAGRRQVQVLDPFEVFFPANDEVRRSWSPFLAFYQYDQSAPGEVRESFLWNAVTWREDGREDRTEFHLGPLLEVERAPRAGRIAVGNGLFGLKREPGRAGWRPFWMEFEGKEPRVKNRESP